MGGWLSYFLFWYFARIFWESGPVGYFPVRLLCAFPLLYDRLFVHIWNLCAFLSYCQWNSAFGYSFLRNMCFWMLASLYRNSKVKCWRYGTNIMKRGTWNKTFRSGRFGLSRFETADRKVAYQRHMSSGLIHETN